MRRLAFGVWVASVLAWAANTILNLYHPTSGNQVLEAAELFAFVVLGGFGYLIARQQPSNTVAWLALVPGLVFPLEALVSLLAEVGLARFGPDHPLTLAAAWCALWVWIPGPYSVPFLLALYPDGRPASPRWRPLIWVLWALVGLTFVVAAFAVGPVDETALPGLQNPLGIPALMPYFELVAPVLFNAIPVVVLVAAVSMVFRYRSAAPVERQQVKWLLWVGILAVPFFLATNTVDVRSVVDSLLNIVFVTLIGGTLFIAVTRLRLYEIDRLIGRTLTYVMVAAVLVAVYLAAVLALGALVGRENPLAVAGATLAAAALFNPLRRRVQRWVDRRFDRARYDGVRVVEEFGARLRSEVDLEGLITDLGGVIRTTLRPTGLSLWLREPL